MPFLPVIDAAWALLQFAGRYQGQGSDDKKHALMELSLNAVSPGTLRSTRQRFLGAISFWPSYPELFRQRGEPPIAQLQWLAFGS